MTSVYCQLMVLCSWRVLRTCANLLQSAPQQCAQQRCVVTLTMADAPQVVTDRPRVQLVRAFLDGSQYSAASIRRYERMFGKGFVSTGGLATTQVRLLHPGTYSFALLHRQYIYILLAPDCNRSDKHVRLPQCCL